MLNMQQHPSAISRLRSQLAAGHIANLSDFWRDAESLNVPLVTPVDGAKDERDVTFLWRARHPLQGVYLRLNRVTDKEHVAKGMMTALPATDIWTLTLRLPASYCGSYSLVEIPPGTPAETIAQSGGRFATLVGHADPLNKTPGINVRGSTQESVLALDKAPAQSEWRGGSPSGQLLTSARTLAGESRRVRLYLPDVDVSQPLGLVVLPDGETWFDHLGVCAAIDAAINNGRIVPVAVLGIDNIDEHERTAILGGRSELIKDIAGQLLPTIRAEHPQRRWADRSRTVLAGQSLGGVSALMAARYAPETFGLALSHSPSMWWTPEGASRPNVFSETDTSWVSEHLLSAPPQGVRIRLCVGSLEGSTVPHVQRLHQQLLTAGVDSHCAMYTGGHDYAWWRGALIDGLGLLQG
ncbi:esterase family protein [Enterobacter hormaechei subsp. xiangfangensis]|nr:esterase family protein [Enterobacter hormaechei]ELC6585141.1 esterase family protein [Enterobacter hormaechei]MBT2045624.1 esterase family protein [Enterobacter hormaechei subsp. xiangfangensis]MBT2094012.1 esterase family protein [Enterobacter hormaechei subsp. xiangfangensis]